MSDVDIERRKEFMENYYCEKKYLLNSLIDLVEELENF